MKRYLILKDGSVYEGYAIGAEKATVGEAVFTTSMSGSMTTLCDPCYYGQIVVQTYPLVGDCKSSGGERPTLFGYVVRDVDAEQRQALDEFLKANGIVGIAGVDTRAITRKIRSSGAINAMIVDNIKDLPKKLAEIKKYKIENAIANTVKECETVFSGDGSNGVKVAVIDFGSGANVEKALIKNGCAVVRVPYSAYGYACENDNVNGYVLSGGGGDPAENTKVIDKVKKLISSVDKPILGIGLGHQLIAIANGFEVAKLKYGHHGANQPVRNEQTGKIVATAQTHNYVVKPNSVNQAIATVAYTNVNDGSIEGLRYANGTITVQFHPEEIGGPQETSDIIKDFVEKVRIGK